MAQKLFFRLNEVVDEVAKTHGMTRVEVLILVKDFLARPPSDHARLHAGD